MFLRVFRSVADYTVCPGSNDLFYIVTYYIKWVTTSWTYSTLKDKRIPEPTLPRIFTARLTISMLMLQKLFLEEQVIP